MTHAEILAKVQRFQNKLDAYYKETECGIPDIGCTLISESHIVYTVKGFKVTRNEEYTHFDRFEDVYNIKTTAGQDDLLEQINYDNRRLNKGWRVWRSENPDAEMERDEEE